MPLEAIERITEIEEQAERLAQQAREGAAALLRDARVRAASLRDELVKKAQEEARETVRAAQEKGRRSGEEALAETGRQCAELRRLAEERMPAAVKLICERIVSG